MLDERFQSLSPAVHRASTVVFDSLEEFVQRKDRQPDGFSYGVTGTPTARELERRIAQLEGGGTASRHSFLSHCSVIGLSR